MEMMTLQPRRRRRRSSLKSKDIAQSNRRIYDPRRWHKRSSSNNVHMSGQPPAGWVLVWAGRFKRWRRRWFVAHPPGLLLHYKSSDQIGQPGCISLVGATIVPAPSKERQLKIVKGSIVYYLRTINRDYRQHARGDWLEQDKKLNRRIAERLQDVEPARHDFLLQLQGLQQSLSTITGVLGFADHPEVPKAMLLPILPSLPEATWRPSGVFPAETGMSDLDVSEIPRTPSDDKLSSPDLGSGDPYLHGRGMLSSLPSSLQENSGHQRSGSRSLFKWKTDGDYQNSKGSGDIRSQKSKVAVQLTGEVNLKRERCRSLSLSLDSSDDGFHHDRSHIGAQCFPGRKTSVRHLSDTELGSKKPIHVFNAPLKQSKRERSDFSCVTTQASGQELERNSIKTLEGDPCMHSKQEAISSNGSMSELVGAANLGVRKVKLDGEGSTRRGRFLAKGPLHAAWNRMQDAFTDALREEIHRVLELEAENAALQESLATLPQLQEDRAAYLKLQERLQKECVCGAKKNMSDREDGEEGDDEDDDTEDEILIVPTEITNEEYFEALEVLSQHEYLARVTTLERQESLAEMVDGIPESPEEGDYTGDTNMLSEAEGEELDQPRTRLPAPRPLSWGFSVWTVLKNAVGRDLSHITMPATINEPLSVLQKCAEELQFRELLEQAVQKENSLERLLYATAFTCASYCGSIHRDAKPFNPLLGETYEFQDDRSWFLAEQVSHHPPIFAFHTESNCRSYQCYGEIEIKNKFWGRSIEVLCNGVAHLKIPKFGDHITWNRATLCIHNVVVGKLWIDNYGEVLVRNYSTGEMSRVRFHKATSREQCRISGKIYDASGTPQYSLFGNYMDRIYACPEACTTFDVDSPDVRLLWKAPQLIEDYRQQYCFTRFTLGLNDLTPKLAEVLPPTDSRFRPDQRALENGDLEKATPEKLRLEEKQRLARKTRKEQGQEWETVWFGQREQGVTQVKAIQDGDIEPSWVYKGRYWEARERQAWENCPDIM
ncbi:hypothetical protein CY35_02G126900 [Sphagnum magellanicum]|nr:hypothetical protein CY35_02G126900 [Sphagnum magellanicum]